MATTVIQNSCVAGALAGILSGRYSGSFTPSDYAAAANAARAIADEFITENTASGAALADGDNAQIGPVVEMAAMGTVMNSGSTSGTAADYLGFGKQIYAVSKQALTKLI